MESNEIIQIESVQYLHFHFQERPNHNFKERIMNVSSRQL
jgi:hypothetical protein